MEPIIILFTLLVVKHFIADFIFQTDTMVREKGTYGAKGGLHHAYVHGLLTAFVMLPLFGSIFTVLKIGLVDAIVHYHIDWAKMNINRHYGYTPADPPFWFWLGVDQLMHYLTYIGIIAWIFM